MMVLLQDESKRFVKEDDGNFAIYSRRMDAFGFPYYQKVEDLCGRWNILCKLANDASDRIFSVGDK